jgi:hypothetical protein
MTEKEFEKLREMSKKREVMKAIRIINLYYQARLYSISLFSCYVTLVDMQSVGTRSECFLEGFFFCALEGKEMYLRKRRKEKKGIKGKKESRKTKRSKREIVREKEKEKHGKIEIENVKM